MFFRFVLDVLHRRITSIQRVPCVGLVGLLRRDTLRDIRINRLFAAKFVFHCKAVQVGDSGEAER